jgi:hypothetical protein
MGISIRNKAKEWRNKLIKRISRIDKIENIKKEKLKILYTNSLKS